MCLFQANVGVGTGALDQRVVSLPSDVSFAQIDLGHGYDCGRDVLHHHAGSDVDVWYIPHTLKTNASTQNAVLTESDYFEFGQIRHPGARHRSLATRALLRSALSSVSDQEWLPHEWTFERSVTGKPQTGRYSPKVHFSCSHTSHVSAIAVSRAGPVGIDIEHENASFDHSMLQHYFSDAERSLISALPVERQSAEFTKLWALKEACIKAIGIPLAEDIAELEFLRASDRDVRGASPVYHYGDLALQTWQVRCKNHLLRAAIAVS